MELFPKHYHRIKACSEPCIVTNNKGKCGSKKCWPVEKEALHDAFLGVFIPKTKKRRRGRKRGDTQKTKSKSQ